MNIINSRKKMKMKKSQEIDAIYRKYPLLKYLKRHALLQLKERLLMQPGVVYDYVQAIKTLLEYEDETGSKT